MKNTLDTKQYETISLGDIVYTLKYCTAVPEVSAAEDEALQKDIEMRGFLTPIYIDENGNIIDGRRKLKIAAKLNRKDFTAKIIPGLTEAEKWSLAEDLNFHRRQVSLDEIRKIMARNRKRIPELALGLRINGQSYRQIGKQLGTSPESVRQAINKVATAKGNTAILPALIVGQDGKKRKAHMPRKSLSVITANSPSETRRAIEVCNAISPSVLPNKSITIKRAERILREEENERYRRQEIYDYSEGSVKLMLGDFIIRGQEIEDNSIDLVFTDLPYEKKALPLWQQVSQLASHKLKAGGVFVSYSGCQYLPQVLDGLGKHLTYLWVGAIFHSGAKKKIYPIGLTQGWKPLLIYYKPPLKIYWPTILDMVSGGREKSDHEWQQSTGEALHFIKAFCPRNGVLLDPCMGSGTSIVAGLESGLGLKCIGIENDKAAYAKAERRIKNCIAANKDSAA